MRNPFSPKPRNIVFFLMHEAEHSGNLKSDDFGFLTKNQNWPFFGQKRSKFAHFGLFLPNATINVPHFRHRNVFFGLLKNGGIFFLGGGDSQI